MRDHAFIQLHPENRNVVPELKGRQHWKGRTLSNHDRSIPHTDHTLLLAELCAGLAVPVSDQELSSPAGSAARFGGAGACAFVRVRGLPFGFGCGI